MKDFDTYSHIGISHECPLTLMSNVQELTDYDYCLVHLTEENKEYRQYFKEAIAKGRKVLLDNSVFELETPFDPDKFVDAINDLNPTWYIVPDFLDDNEKTKQSIENWTVNYLPKIKTKSKLIGSIQGKSFEELADCYKFMSSNSKVDKIAITFNSMAFYSICPDILKGEKVTMEPSARNLQLWTEGRQRFISMLVAMRIWNDSKPHHLLGCGYINEFKNPMYHRLNIETLDTSNPVAYGMSGQKYIPGIGNLSKPGMKICNHLNDNISESQWKLIQSNILEFNKIVNKDTVSIEESKFENTSSTVSSDNSIS